MESNNQQNIASPDSGFNQSFQAAPTWLQDYLQSQSGQQAGGFYDPSSVMNANRSMISGAQQQYGDDFYNPAFLGMQGYDPSSFNPFQSNISGNVGGRNPWEFNSFTGLSGVNNRINYLDHYAKHGEAAMKNQSGNDQRFFSEYGAYAPGVHEYGNSGSALYGNTDDRRRGALGLAGDDLQKLRALQAQYGSY